MALLLFSRFLSQFAAAVHELRWHLSWKISQSPIKGWSSTLKDSPPKRENTSFQCDWSSCHIWTNRFQREEKYNIVHSKCTKGRNEYLMCVRAANAALHRWVPIVFFFRGLRSARPTSEVPLAPLKFSDFRCHSGQGKRLSFGRWWCTGVVFKWISRTPIPVQVHSAWQYTRSK